MANPKHVEIFNQGRKSWNHWRSWDLQYGPDLSGINMASADLRWFDLRGANLEGANLSSADLSDALLDGVILKDANLTQADLTRARLGAVYITKAELGGADFSQATFGGTGIDAVDLSQVKGLHNTRHWCHQQLTRGLWRKQQRVFHEIHDVESRSKRSTAAQVSVNTSSSTIDRA